MKDIKTLIIRNIEKKDSVSSGQLASILNISRQAIHRHLSALVREGRILRQGSSRRTTCYILNTPSAVRKLWKGARRFQKRVRARGLEEDRLLKDVEGQPGLFDGLSAEARTNFDYTFTEIVNNAIEHSRTTFIQIDVAISGKLGSFTVADAGVGIFKNIQEKNRLAGELEAIGDLIKGKQTTMPERHSGEGIFFTSKIADRFVIESHKKRLIIDNDLDEVFVEDIRFRKGTRVRFEFKIESRRRLDELFREYTNENFEFQKSSVRVRLFAAGETYISRSQAKRLVHSLERFREVVLDFKGVETVGQAFADEVFRVFQKLHPEIVITSVNCNENVDFMIRRALASTAVAIPPRQRR